MEARVDRSFSLSENGAGFEFLADRVLIFGQSCDVYELIRKYLIRFEIT